MASLDIRPHSRRISRLAIVGLCLLAAGSFVVGAVRQIQSLTESSPFPAAQASTPQPAAALQVAGAPPPLAPTPTRHAEPPPAPPDEVADTASSAPAVDTSQAAAEPAPAAPPPAPEAAPAPSDPPT
jgi:hypothetical protein